MKKTFWLFIFLLLPFIAAGNGKVWPSEGVPPEVPYQRALIMHHDNEQVLILQTRFDPFEEITEESEYCWVVPVPSEAEFEYLKPWTIERLFQRADRMTYPDVLQVRDILKRAGLIFLAAWFILSIAIIFAPIFIIKFNIRCSQKSKTILAITATLGIIIPVTIAMTIYFFLPAGTRATSGRRGVEVVRSQSVGPYDAFLLQAESSTDLHEWLTDNGFAYYEEDEPVLEEYIEKGWYFVFTRIRPGTDISHVRTARHGLMAPIVTRFHSEYPVYPLALTSTVGVDTEVVIYLLSDKRMSPGERMPLHTFMEPSLFAKNQLLEKTKATQTTYEKPIGDNIRWEESEHIEGRYYIHPFEDWEPEFRYLSKFKATLSPEEMRQDLVFNPDEDLTDYRKRVIRW